MVTVEVEESKYFDESVYVCIQSEHGSCSVHIPREELPLTIEGE